MFVRRVWPHSPFTASGIPDPTRVRRDIDRLFDVLWSREGSGSGVFPAINVTRDGERYVLRAELPGMRDSDLNIQVERNKLTISGKRDTAAAGEGISYHRRERAGGSFSRSLTLPDDISEEGVEAAYTDGVLTITLPKSAAAKARQIKVKNT